MKQLSTGEMLRAAAAAGTETGLRAKAIIDRGELVSDDIVVGIIADRLEAPDLKKGFILDGFPRNTAQAKALDQMLGSKGLKLDAVIGMSSGWRLRPLLKLESYSSSGQEIGWAVTPALMYTTRKGGTWVLGVKRTSLPERNLGLSLEIWRDF